MNRNVVFLKEKYYYIITPNIIKICWVWFKKDSADLVMADWSETSSPKLSDECNKWSLFDYFKAKRIISLKEWNYMAWTVNCTYNFKIKKKKSIKSKILKIQRSAKCKSPFFSSCQHIKIIQNFNFDHYGSNILKFWLFF